MNGFYDRPIEASSDSHNHTLFFDSSGNRSRAYYEAASLLAVWSLFCINEGSSRLIQMNPTIELYKLRPLPPFVLFVAAILQIVLGFLGLIVALTAFIINVHSPPITKICMFVQFVLAIYVFGVYVFAIPIFRILSLSAPLTPNLTIGASKAVICFGILTTFSFQLALLGGQFLFMGRLVSSATGDFPSFTNGSILRPITWNLNVANAGVWTLVTSLFIMYGEGGGRLVPAYFAPPHIGRLPLFAFFAGIIMLFWGMAGALIAYSGGVTLMRYFVGGSFVIYIIMYLNFAVLQLALIPNGSPDTAALHSGIVFILSFLGPYFIVKQVEEKGKYRMDRSVHSSIPSSSSATAWVEEGRFVLEKL